MCLFVCVGCACACVGVCVCVCVCVSERFSLLFPQGMKSMFTLRVSTYLGKHTNIASSSHPNYNKKRLSFFHFLPLLHFHCAHRDRNQKIWDMRVWLVSAEDDEWPIYRPGRCVFTACLKLRGFSCTSRPQGKSSQFSSCYSTSKHWPWSIILFPLCTPPEVFTGYNARPRDV